MSRRMQGGQWSRACGEERVAPRRRRKPHEVSVPPLNEPPM
jgi:hypothetical protein